MLNIIWLILDGNLDPILEPRNPAGHECIKEKCDSTLCNCLVSVNVSTDRSELFDEQHTLVRQVWITIVPDRQGESVAVGKARGFHQNLLRGARPNRRLIFNVEPDCPTWELTLSSTFNERKCNSIASIVPSILSSKKEATSGLGKFVNLRYLL